jgi:hypothetical protein
MSTLHTCAVLDDTVKCWGFGKGGALGYGDAQNRGDKGGEKKIATRDRTARQRAIGWHEAHVVRRTCHGGAIRLRGERKSDCQPH